MTLRARPARGGDLRTALAAVGILALSGCAPVPSLLDVPGPGAARIADLFWLMTIVGAVVFAAFCGVLAVALRRRGEPAERPDPEHDRRATRLIVLLGAVIPSLILVPILLFTLHTLDALDPRDRRADLVVEVVGKQWWWEVRYLDGDPALAFTTANEIHVPVGRRVELRLLAADVIHSLWVPELQGKTDLIPGRRNVTWIQADRPGIYRGQCAEYCGRQHTKMALLVVAQPQAEFDAWAAGQRRPAAEPRDSLGRAGRDVFLGSACALCHAVRGTPAGGAAGPDLTHLASRRTLAAGTEPNTPGHLAGWIANPQGLKPGTPMPRVPLTPDELRAMTHYLTTLD